MNSFMEVLNRPADAFRKQNQLTAWILVFIAVLVDSVFVPLLNHYAGITHPDIDYLHMLKITVFGFISYILICMIFWLVCKCFGSRAQLTSYIKTWGLSFIPTIICAVVVAFTETFFYVFWNNTIWGMLISIVFVGILIWKTIYYIIFLQEVAGLRRGKLIGAFIVMGIFILVLAQLNGYFGLVTPIL